MERTEIAVAGSGAIDPRVRLCVTPGPGRDRFEPSPLHDDRRTGTFARVVAGQVRTRHGWVAAAVKLQRDQALNRDEHAVVAAKFDREREIHVRLQAGGSPPPHVIRLLDSRGPDATGPDVPPPCILCRHAAHALALRCPACGDELTSPRLDQQELLRCPRCNESYQPTQQRLILRRSVQQDPACEGCPNRTGGAEESCLRAAGVLNFFPSRVLTLERLDLDLDDYLTWAAGGPAETPRAAAFRRHRARLARLDEATPEVIRPVARLARAIDLVRAVASGVAALHRRRVAHLDLKPANVCVRFRGPNLDVRLIDLGLAVSAELPSTLRDLDGSFNPETPFTAPEYLTRTRRLAGATAWFAADQSACTVVWPGDRAADHPVPGDRLFFDPAGAADRVYRVCDVRSADERVLVLARAADPGSDWTGPPADPWPLLETTPNHVTLDHEPICGYPADLFSLGLLSFAVLSGRTDVRPFRESLANVGIALQEWGAELGSLPGRELIRAAEEATGKTAEFLTAFLTHVRLCRRRYGGELAPLVDELIGAILRLVIRGAPPLWAVPHRGGDARAGLRRFRGDLRVVRQAVATAEAAARGQVVLRCRLDAAARLRDESPAPLSPARFVYPDLDLAAGGGTAADREAARGRYRPDAPWEWDAWEDELVGGPLRALGFLARYARSYTRTRDGWERFLRWYQELPGSQDPLRDRVRHPAERMAAVRQVAAGLRAVDDRLAAEFFGPWDRLLRRRRWWWPWRPGGGRVTVTEPVRAAPDEIRGLVEAIDRLQAQSRADGALRQQDFQRALAAWNEFARGPEWLPALQQIATTARAQQDALIRAAAVWTDGWQVQATALARFAEVLDSLTVDDRRYLPRSQREQVSTSVIPASVEWLESHWPHPDDAAACVAHWGKGMPR